MGQLSREAPTCSFEPGLNGLNLFLCNRLTLFLSWLSLFLASHELK